MLSLIHIENMAVIERCEIEFSDGFNVLTGETGAGKSIIIDSINALLGSRVTRDIVRFGNKKGSVLGVFTKIPNIICEKLGEYGIEVQDDTLHINREISSDGKSVCRINLKPVPASVLKEIAPYLVNIHGQHDGQRLMSDENHINYLDKFANNDAIIDTYQKKYIEYNQIKSKLKKLMDTNVKIDERISYLSDLVKEIEFYDIKPLEEEELLEKRKKFQNFEQTAKALQGASLALTNSENSAYDNLSLACSSLSSIAQVSLEYSAIFEKSEDIKYQIEELAEKISSNLLELDLGDEDIDFIEQRLDAIYKIKRKYGGSVESALSNYSDALAELKTLENVDKSILELQELYKIKREELIICGKNLQKNRLDNAILLENAIINELNTLDMSNILFKVSVENSGKLAKTGIDNVSFLIATNKGDVLKPISKIASGGELSRIMLAIKNILTSSEEVSTLIFDEVDTGVSGRAGVKIANKLYDVSQKKQVLCVTHLASIASMADNHYFINKENTADKTFTIITKMNENEREREIARIIGGDIITDTSLLNAKELIKNANLYKIGGQK